MPGLAIKFCQMESDLRLATVAELTQFTSTETGIISQEKLSWRKLRTKLLYKLTMQIKDWLWFYMYDTKFSTTYEITYVLYNLLINNLKFKINKFSLASLLHILTR